MLADGVAGVIVVDELLRLCCLLLRELPAEVVEVSVFPDGLVVVVVVVLVVGGLSSLLVDEADLLAVEFLLGRALIDRVRSSIRCGRDTALK